MLHSLVNNQAKIKYYNYDVKHDLEGEKIFELLVK